MAKLRKFVFKDSEGIIEDNIYYAKPNKKVIDKITGQEVIVEDDIIPFLKRQGFIEEEVTVRAAKELDLEKKEIKTEF